ncbi:MAG: glucose-1-phosphate thymidylyltransferase, partial [Flavobacteriales bacterium]|nr:glucose-1-phosphate thymidylyltransferase [Flavobacteriales bacterium]
EIEKDFSLITAQKKSRPLSSSNVLIGPKNKLFIEEGAYIEGCVLNTDFGSVYIGKNAEVMEGSIIRGGFSVLEESKIKLGSKIYGPTSIGPKCRVGGEVKNSIFQGYSNKSHDGYLGNSIIGEWVNLGADTNCSNLKNTFSSAKVWSYEEKKMVDSGELFLGCCIGDFSKTGINTMINTASVIGVNANLFGSGFQKKFVPSFSWGERETYTLSKAWEVNKNIARLTGEELSDEDHLILQAIHSYQL